MFGPGRALDPERYFIVVPSMFGNGFSSSPSNTPAPFDRARFPGCTLLDNVLCQERFLRKRFGIGEIALALGWSMAAQNVYQWAALFPDRVHRLVPLCGSARTSPHNFVFLEGAKRALTADAAWAGGDYAEMPVTGLKAMSQVYAGWAFSQAFYRGALYERLGYDSLGEFLARYWEDSFLRRDANDMLAHIWTWQHGDISANETFERDFRQGVGRDYREELRDAVRPRPLFSRRRQRNRGRSDAERRAEGDPLALRPYVGGRQGRKGLGFYRRSTPRAAGALTPWRGGA